MAIRYKALTELYQEAQRSVTAPGAWQRFLVSACRNYRLPFDEQLLVHAQRPDATAVLEIERWNKRFGRWVNRGANGIAVFDGEHTGRPRLKYYFDISDTHEGNFPQPLPLWAVRPEYEPEIIETLENSFGELEHKEDLGAALLSAAKNAVEDNIQDYLSELKTITEGSFLEELDDLNLEVLYRKALENSIGYMLMVRCGLDPAGTFEDEDFRDVLNFNTPETLNALGVATGDISQMCLSEISRTVLALQRQPQKENRTFADQQKIQYPVTEQRNQPSERSFENERDHIHETGRLQPAEPSAPAGAGGSLWEIRIASEEVSERTPQDMAQLSGKSPEELEAELSGVIFRNIEGPENPDRLRGASLSLQAFSPVTADEYLSGNVRRKLRMAKAFLEAAPDSQKAAARKQVEALEAVQPQDLGAGEIGVRIGANWVPIDVYQQFMVELLTPYGQAQNRIKILRSESTGQWNITEKNFDRANVKANTTYGTKRMSAYHILEQTLNQKDVRVFDYIEDEHGNKKPVLNKKETAIAQDRQELIKQRFSEWVWKDIDRRERLCAIYNETFNSSRPREYDGQHIRFEGMNPAITLRPHQINAIAHVMYGGNTLLAHEVGAGKSATRS